MLPMKIVLALYILCVGVHSFAYILHPLYLLEEPNFPEETIDDRFLEHSRESFQPRHVRLARQVVSGTENRDGSEDVSVKVPLAGNDKNELSAHSFINGLKKDGTIDSAGGGLALDNVKGHQLSLTGTHNVNSGNEITAAGRLNLLNIPDHNVAANAFITKNFPKDPLSPDFTTRGGSLDYTYKDRNGLSLSMTQDSLLGDQLKAAGRLNLLSTPNHELDANAFVARTMPNKPFQLDYNTYGGNLDYLYRDKLGASVGVAHTPQWGQTDYSARGSLNLFKDPSTSLDLYSQLTKSQTSFQPDSPLKSDFGFTLRKSW